ncbi:MAG: hypothetical protein ACLQE9_05000 [Roseiarcus sp.]
MKAKFVVSALATAVLIATLQPGAAAAYHYYVERTAAAGAPTHVWTFYNCINCIGRKRWPFSGSAFVEHGTVEFKDSVKNRCGLANLPTREVWYTSAPGFSGLDKLTFPRGHGRPEIIAVIVR